MSYQPPFSINARIINQISAIAEQLGRLSSRYYQVLEDADRAADTTPFIEFMLDIIHDTLIQNSTDQVSDQVSDQVQQLNSIMDDQYQNAQERSGTAQALPQTYFP